MEKSVEESQPSLSHRILFALDAGLLLHFSGSRIRAVSISQAQGSPGLLAGRIHDEAFIRTEPWCSREAEASCSR